MVILRNKDTRTEYQFKSVFIAAKNAINMGRSNQNGWIMIDELGIEYPSLEWRYLASACATPKKEKGVDAKDIFFTKEEISEQKFDSLMRVNGYRSYRKKLSCKIAYYKVVCKGESYLLCNVAGVWGDSNLIIDYCLNSFTYVQGRTLQEYLSERINLFRKVM